MHRDYLLNLISKDYENLNVKEVPAELKQLCLTNQTEGYRTGLERMTPMSSCNASGVESITGLGAKEEYQIQNDSFSVLMRKPENFKNKDKAGSYILKYSKIKP